MKNYLIKYSVCGDTGNRLVRTDSVEDAIARCKTIIAKEYDLSEDYVEILSVAPYEF